LENKNLMFGMRSTGRLHLGHYEGVLKNMTALQPKYDCFIEVADWHSITTSLDTKDMKNIIFEMVCDWLAAGIDPKKSTIFVQSCLREHAELHILLSMLTPVSWLERVPTYKEQIQQLDLGENTSYGFLGYPILQAVDIALYKAAHVPVGRDQLPHLEITREILRKFNNYFNSPVFVEPQAVLTEMPMLLGTDNRKMSKSYGNSIYLGETAEETSKKVLQMITDPNRIKKSDPGNPDICNVYSYHKIYSGQAVLDRVKDECPKASIGCVECKKILAANLNEKLAAHREKREQYVKNPGLIEDIINDGNKRASLVASATLSDVNAKMGLKYFAK